MSQRVQFECSLPPRVLRRNTHTVARKNPKPGQSARRAIHWSDRSQAAEEYAEAVWIAYNQRAMKGHTEEGCWCDTLPWPRASVHYDWHSTHQMDEDNIISSMKVALDTCTTKGRRPLGIIEDDKGVTVSATWQKAATKKAERVVITITEGA